MYWIGGPPDAGKSTVADALAKRFGLTVYHCDDSEQAHYPQLPDGSAYRALTDASPDERWVNRTAAAMFQRELGSFRERWPLVLKDLRNYGDVPVVAEGFGLTPRLVATCAPPERALFLVPNGAFKANSFEHRGKPTGAKETRDPERARRNALQRDTLIAEEIRLQAEVCGMRVVEVASGTGVETLTVVIAELFGLTTPP